MLGFIIGLLLLFSSLADAATRLGLHVTQEELDRWRVRMTDNVNTMNGVTFQSIYQNRILNEANAFKGQTHPQGDGYWVGWTGSGCAPMESDTAPRPGGGGTPYGRGNGAYLARSAFVFLLTGDVSYATPVKQELLHQITVPGTDFTNTAKWCPDALGAQNAIETPPWVYRLMIAYDYLLAGGYTGFTPTEKTNILNWFKGAADLWDHGQHRAISLNGYKGVYSVPQNLACTGSACTSLGSLLYFGGPTFRQTHNHWNNVGTIVPMLQIAYGLLAGNNTHIENAKAWLTAFLKIAVWDNGSFQDFKRWSDCNPGCPGAMWSHAGGVWGPVTAAIDMLARTGDTSLYTLSGPTQVIGGNGGTVGWHTSVDLAAKMINKTVSLYGTTTAGGQNPSTLLTWDVGWDGLGAYHDFSLMVANMFYKDSDVTTAMERNILGCKERQYGGCTAAVWAFWAELPFMYGKLQGVVDPYSLAAPEADIVSNLEMHLEFDENTGTNAADSTANNHNGTLAAGATWGAAKLGTSALVLDGSATSKVTIPGGLTNPTSATLAAWIFPTAWPSTNNEVVNLRNGIILRTLGSGSVRGSFFINPGYSGVSVASGVPLNAWTHIAYTMEPGAQRVYVNGTQVGSASASNTVSYTGLPADTLIGNHPTDTTNFRFTGRIDDVRVYTRALSAVDIQALYNYNPVATPTIQITSPTLDDAYSTNGTSLLNLGGTGQSSTGVLSVTRTCPTCTPTTSTATCNPVCGTGVLTTNFSFAPIDLAMGTNLVTVTVTDASSEQSDQLTVTRVPLPPVGTCSHYANQAGGGNGESQGSPFRVVDFCATGAAVPGATLCMLPGTYTGANSMILPPTTCNGTASLPITVRALNDGTVLIDGQNARNVLTLSPSNQWWVIDGINGRNGLTAVFEFLGNNNLGRRLLGWNATSGQPNSTIFTVRGNNTWVEDCGGWGTNVRTILQGSGTTASTGGYRRCWYEWRSHPGGTTSPGRGMVPGEGQRFENIIGTWHAH